MLDRALAHAPDDPLSLINYATIERLGGARDRALACLDRALACDPAQGIALLNRSALRLALGDPAGAYDDAVVLTGLEPDAVAGWRNRMFAALGAGKYDDALACARRTMQLGANGRDIREGAATALAMLRRFDEADREMGGTDGKFNAREVALVRGVDAARQCDWRGYPAWLDDFTCFADELDANGATLEASELPFHAGAAPLSPKTRAALMTAHARAVTKRAIIPNLPRAPRQARERLRIGYLSADFRRHPASYLLQPLLQRHDRRRYEVYAYSVHADDGSEVRRAIVKSVDHFREITHYSAAEAVGLIRYDDIDILIDVSGYYEHARPEILCARPARVQIAYFSTPASSRLGVIDFRVTDSVSSPTGSEADWSETLLRLPACHFPCDLAWARDAGTPRRADFDLPENTFVMCCMNNAYKIDPLVFGLWMRILAALPDALLWVLESGQTVARNLRQAATGAGIDSRRLVFAPSAPRGTHLARMACADLFVDTLFYGAHTVGVEAAAVGLPLLTCPGQRLSSRISASIMQAAGMDEMVVTSHDDYVATAVALGRDPARLAALKAKMRSHQSQAPLYDLDRLARDLEAQYELAWNAKGAPALIGAP